MKYDLIAEVYMQMINENSDQYLYHATYGAYKKSIKKLGLITNSKNKNYEDSNPNKLYLASDPDVAVSYAETSDMVPEDYLDHIVVYKVRKSNLDANKLHSDKNVIDGDSTFEYDGNIPTRHLEIHQEIK